MESVIIKDIGIHPWEQLNPSTDGRYITISLLNQQYTGAWKTWCALGSLLTQKWPKIVNWHTDLLPCHSKSEEYISQKSFYKNSNPGDIYKKNELTKIYSQIINLDCDPYKIDPMRMTNYRTSVTLMLENNSNLEHLWHKLSSLSDISKTDDFKFILSDSNSIALRFHDSETHGVAQLICHSKHLPLLNETINKMNLEEIRQEDVYAYIHR